MKYRRLGRTNLKVSVIGIGGGAFNNPEVSPDDVEKIMEGASKLGVNFIETAEDYGEEKIGYALENIKTKFIISTKSLMRDEKHIEKSIENSLKKLNTDYIHIYQLHNVVSVDDLEERLRCVLPVLKEAQHEGIIGYIGITSDFVNPLMKAIETNEFDVVEAHYNVGNTLSERLFEGAKKRNIGVIVAKPLGGGLLIEREPENRKRKGSEVMNVDNALRFVLSNRNVSTALVGAKSLEHLRECASVTRNNFNISLQERKNIAKKMLGFLGKNFCRSCVNCMPCDINGWDFNIPEVLRLHGFCFIYGHKADLMNGYRKLNFKVDACNYCRRCEKKCPFNLPIAKMLKEVDIVFKKYEHFYSLANNIDDLIKHISRKIKEKKNLEFDRFLFEDILKLVKEVEKLENETIVSEKFRESINDIKNFERSIKNDIKEKSNEMYGLLDKTVKLYLQAKNLIL